MTNVASRLSEILMRIDVARSHANRTDKVALIAVSKGHDQYAVRQALEAGQRQFGENRVQEAAKKFAGLKSEYQDISLHLIGPLQTNKAEDAVRLFDVIQTLDREKLADALAKAIEKTTLRPSFYIQVNIAKEPQKSGVAPEELSDFLHYCNNEKALKILGLMCIPPQSDDPLSHFRRLHDLAIRYGLLKLSMGMTGDFERAIACGATEVRVGTAIFGTRDLASLSN